MRSAKAVILLSTLLILTSCATLSRNGVGRVKRYTIESDRLPASFDGYSIAFISDTHYPSKFTQKRLGKLARKLRNLQPSTLLMGGDYLASPDYTEELFDTISSVKTEHGIFAVPGNHDYRWHDRIAQVMNNTNVVLLCDSFVYLKRDCDRIALLGIHNSFKADKELYRSLAKECDTLFTILLTHTPDYAEDVDAIADVALSGHTHGGQVTLLGIYTPVKNTKYGTRFLRGMNFTDNSTPVITTNGVGTSRRKIRFCAPSEIVVVTLRSVQSP